MRILFLSELYHPYYGGAEYATHLYAQKLGEKGHKIIVLTHRYEGESPQTRDGNVSTIRCNLINEASPKYSIQARFDVLFSSFFRRIVEWSDFVYIPRLWYTAIPVIKLMGKPVVVHLHDYLPVCSLSTLYDTSKDRECDGFSCRPSCVVAAERYQNKDPLDVFASTLLNTTIGPRLGSLVELSDIVICVSEKQRDILLRRAPGLTNKTHVVYNQMPRVQEIPLEGRDFGYFGGRSYIKGVSTLYDAIRRLRKGERKIPAIHASKMIPGSATFKKHRNGSGIIPYGRLGVDDFNKMYSLVQTVIVPSIWHEPLPYVVAEALLRERLVIASNTGGIPELIEGCRGVWSCSPGNSQQLAYAIDAANNMDADEKVALGKQNRVEVLKRFDDEKNIQRFIRIVSKVL